MNSPLSSIPLRARQFAVTSTILLGAILLITMVAAAPSQASITACSDGRTVLQMQTAMIAGKLKSTGLTTCYLRRIQSTNDQLHAVLQAFPVTATAEAIASDARRNHGLPPRSALEGIPVLIKDNINTDGPGNVQKTTAGSKALAMADTPDDAFLVQQLRDAGAVVLGKANLNEWAGFRTLFPGVEGWSGLKVTPGHPELGQTNNPYGLNRTTCGSSSGPGVATAADLAAVTVGTETSYSIVCPAGMNGVVGLKPSFGLVSNAGVVPISRRADTPGSLGRSVSDTAVLLNRIQGVNPADAGTNGDAGPAAGPATQRNYLTSLNPNALDGKRIGVWSGIWGGSTINPDVAQVLANTRETLTAAGATLVDVNSYFDGSTEGTMSAEMTSISANLATTLTTEFKHDIAQYLASRTNTGLTSNDLAGLIEFNNAHADTELSIVDGNQNAFVVSQATSGNINLDPAAGPVDPVYAAAVPNTTDLARKIINRAVVEQDLDAIVAPTNGPAWITDLVNGDDRIQNVDSSLPASTAGYPAISVPAGYSCDGKLPIGMTFFNSTATAVTHSNGRAVDGRWGEPSLISIAYAFEKKTNVRQEPTLPDTVSCSWD
jgi:amidase